MLEKEVEGKLKKRIEKEVAGALCLKFVSPGYTGVPDRAVFLPGGHIVLVETKKPGKKERRRQEYVQAKLRELGFTVFPSVDSEERVEAVLQYIREVTER